MIVTAWNPETEGLEKTNLSQVVQAATNSLRVKNTDRISQNDRILIGEMGMEQSEVVTVGSGKTTTQLPLTGNLKFAHSSDEPVYRLRFDQVLFYRSDEPDGSYDLIATVDIDVDNRELITEYEDTTGTGTSFYKTKLYNSVTAEETLFSDYISADGYGKKTIGSVIQTAVNRVKDAEYTVLTTDDYLDIATEVNNDISSQSERPYTFTRRTALLNRVAGQPYIDLPEDYYKFKDIVYTSKTGSFPSSRPLEPISIDNFDTGYGAQASSDMLSRVALEDGTNRLLLKPTPRTNATGAYKVTYYREIGEFKSLQDEVITPNTLIYKYKFMSEYYSEKSSTDASFGRLATQYEQKYGNELMKLQRSNRKDVGTPRSFMDSSRTSSVRHSPGRRYVL